MEEKIRTRDSEAHVHCANLEFWALMNDCGNRWLSNCQNQTKQFLCTSQFILVNALNGSDRSVKCHKKSFYCSPQKIFDGSSYRLVSIFFLYKLNKQP